MSGLAPSRPATPNVPNDTSATQAWVNAHFKQQDTSLQQNGGVSTQTPGAVSSVTIAHGLGVKPKWYTAQPAEANARGAPASYLSVDATNITLNFTSALTAATQYAWVWSAHV